VNPRRENSHCYEKICWSVKDWLKRISKAAFNLLTHSTSPVLPVSARSDSEDFSSHWVMRKLIGKTIINRKKYFLRQDEGKKGTEDRDEGMKR
jgi:hypothetical protein